MGKLFCEVDKAEKFKDYFSSVYENDNGWKLICELYRQGTVCVPITGVDPVTSTPMSDKN